VASIQLKSGDKYDIPKEGSLGLLALGDIGLEAWRAAKRNEKIQIDIQEKPKLETGKQKLVLIGWDAADWKIINPMLDKGLLPNLAKLIQQGTMGNLATLDPPYSPMLWTSIATGKRAYDHGIHGFSEVDATGKHVQPVMSSSRKVKAIWDILGERNKRCHVVGWWPSHPAEKLTGISISNLFQKSKGKTRDEWNLPYGSIYPKDLEDRFKNLRIHANELTEKHLLPFIPEAWKINQSKDRRLQAVVNITAETSTLHSSFTNILRLEDYDFAALYLDGIDHYCHGFMKYFPPQRPHISKPDYDLYKHVITSAYRFHDMMLGRIMELIPDDATVLLISDHGFQPDHLRPKNIPKEPAGPAHEHSPYGIIVAKGPGIKKDELVFGASVIDITPTILKIFDLPIANDMEGRILHNLFETYSPSEKINTYETSKLFSPNTTVSDEVKDQLMSHLIDLGYVEDNADSNEQKLKRTQDECDFNLARAYLEGRKIKEAEQILKHLFDTNKQTPRYAIRLAACYQMQGKNDEAKEIILHLKDLGVYSEEAIYIFEGSLLLGTGKPQEAIKKFKSAAIKVNENSSELNHQIAQCYLQLNRHSEAINCLEKELEKNYDNPLTHQLISSSHFREKNYKEAAEYSLSALGLQYNNAQNHATLGRSLYHLGQYSDAAHALEQCLKLTPENNFIRELLINIYRTQLIDNEKSKLHAEKLKTSYKGEVFVVSGLPRSGTSMLMQMLTKGGLESFTDNNRKADENNLEGYFEHDLVKHLHNNSNWIGLADHKLIKVIAPMVKHLPLNYKYKIVFIERPLEEVATSQIKMLDRLGHKKTQNTELQGALEKTAHNTKSWLKARQNMDVLYIHHNDVIKNPIAASAEMNKFFNGQLEIETMAACVKPELYREKMK